MATQVTKVNNGPTPGGATGEPNALERALDRIRIKWREMTQFFHEVRVEMRQVTWPSRDDVRSTTFVVIATVFFFGLYLFLVDMGVSRLVTQVIAYFKK
jgi:preprotein translocase subunit SecE